MVLYLLDQLQTLRQLCLIEFLGLLIRSETTVALVLDISKAYKMVWHAGLLHKRKCLLNVMSVITGFDWPLMESLTRMSK